MGNIFSYCFDRADEDPLNHPLIDANLILEDPSKTNACNEEIVVKEDEIKVEPEAKVTEGDRLSIDTEAPLVTAETSCFSTDLTIDDCESDGELLTGPVPTTYYVEEEKENNENAATVAPALEATTNVREPFGDIANVSAANFYNKNLSSKATKGPTFSSPASGGAMPFTSVSPPQNTSEFRTMLRNGFEVKKFGRTGRSKKLIIWANEDFDSLLWKSDKAKNLTLRGGLLSPGLDTNTNVYHFALKNVKDVVIGVAAFKRRTTLPRDFEKCLSLVTETRSLDIECHNVEIRDAVAKGFLELLNIESAKEVSME